MRRGSARMSLVVALVGLLVFGATPAAASPPGSGDLATDVDQAVAWFRKTVEPCIDHELFVQFTAGTVRNPLGTRPSAFSDVVVELRVLDTCVGGELDVLSGVTTGIDPNFTRLEQATLDHVAVELSGGGVSITLVLDLVWRGNDDATVLITRDGDYLREEQLETAEVRGRVKNDGAAAFTVNDLTSASISFLRERHLPRS